MPKKSTIEFCESNVVHDEVVNNVKKRIPSDQTLNTLGNLFKIIGDTTRVKILYSISEEELCVCDISAVLNMTHSAISHQLKVLKDARIVKNRREGKNVYYSLDDEHIEQIFNMGLVHINEK
ncbi:MAG: metalloregulator ArsR/SmtB family transcription factor [Bacilli bacterium]|nr:metalloregulator ArsR/SmtB family transcription factor [Bacilli bacterium]